MVNLVCGNYKYCFQCNVSTFSIEMAETVSRETGKVYITSSDHPDVIAGQVSSTCDSPDEIAGQVSSARQK